MRERERDDDVVETSVELMTEDQTETKRWKTMKTMTNYSKKGQNTRSTSLNL